MIDSGTLLQGRFLIEEKIGSGGMGAVYRAIDQKFGSRVAIKQTFYGDKELAEAFEREARLLNGLHHPILPYVSDSFTENGGLFLVMEYIEGDDLSELLKRGETFSVDTVIGWAFDLLDGLDYLHSQEPPVIHRDIKPNNLKLTSRGKIVLLDFGMAKETSSNTLEARSVFGYSRRYSPLEQIEGTGTDARSDIFSLGASLYHLMTGNPPADVLARASAIIAGKEDPLIRADMVNPAIPERVALVLNSALALNAEHRFASAETMSDALEEAIDASHTSEEMGRVAIPITQPESPAVESSALMAAGSTASIQEMTDAPDDDTSSVTPFIDGTKELDYDADTASRVRHTDKAFTTRSAVENFRNRIRKSEPGTVPPVRYRRPSRVTYAAWLPILILCLGAILFGAYRALRPNVEPISSVTAEPATTASPADVVADSPTTTDVATSDEPVEALGSGIDGNEKEKSVENPIALRNGPVAVKPDTARRDSRDISTDTSASSTKSTDRTPSADRASQKSRTATPARTNRRTVTPAYERPGASSIEAIMTGVPYERRRWDNQRDSWSEEELRRRRMRRMRRYQQPF